LELQIEKVCKKVPLFSNAATPRSFHNPAFFFFPNHQRWNFLLSGVTPAEIAVMEEFTITGPT
jgi:hypothetical protein